MTASKACMSGSKVSSEMSLIMIHCDIHLLVSYPGIDLVTKHECLSAVRGLSQEITGLIPVRSDNILSWRLIVKYFLHLFSPFCGFRKGSCHFLADSSRAVVGF